MSSEGAGPTSQPEKPKRQRQLRAKRADDEQDEGPSTSQAGANETSELQKTKLEEMRLLQRMRKRMGGTSADALALAELPDGLADIDEKDAGEEKSADIMGGFSKARTVVQHDEDPNMEAFIEAELARRLGKRVDGAEKEDPEVKRQRMEADMYKIPDEYKSKLVGDTVVPGTSVIISEVALSAMDRVRNIEAVENMKKKMLGGGHDDDITISTKGQKISRKNFVENFGKQKRIELSREELEEQHRRMKYVSERRPAVPLHKGP